MILFLDDEPFFNQSYVQALEDASFTVRLEPNVSVGLSVFRQRVQEIEIVLLDIMFVSTGPLPVEVDKKKIMGGSRIGVEILRLMNETPGGREIPKLILTNVATADFYAQYSSSSEVVRCLRKRDVLPSELVQIVKEVVNRGGQ